MKDGINAAKYVAESLKNLYSDHKSAFLRISTEVDDVVTISSKVIDAIEDIHTIEDNTSSLEIVQIQTSATVSDIANIIRFDNSTGNNNCWLNCVIRVLAHMLNLVLYQPDQSQNPMINAFLKYLKNNTTMKKGGTLCVDGKSLYIRE